MVSSYDEELVIVSVVEEDADPRTNYLVVVSYHSRSVVVACSSSRS
jgi:hypothetical protein